MVQQFEESQAVIFAEEEIVVVKNDKYFFKCDDCMKIINVANITDDNFQSLACHKIYVRLECPKCGSNSFRFFKTK